MVRRLGHRRSTVRGLPLACATALLLSAAGRAAAQTWDGGGADDNFTTSNNWFPNGVPANNGTADLVFAGAVRLAPEVNVNFDVDSVTFSNTAGAFTVGAPGGTALAVRGGGITNNDADPQLFTLPVTFATGSSVTASSGDLALRGGVALGANTVTIGGAFETEMRDVTGTGTLVKNGTG